MDAASAIVLDHTTAANSTSEALGTSQNVRGGTSAGRAAQPINDLNGRNGKDIVGRGGGRPVVAKRACNECRQQKLRCDVITEPYTICSRCRRLHLVCRIDHNFKRVEKRRERNERRKLTEDESRPITIGHRAPLPTMVDQYMVGVEIEPEQASDLSVVPTLPTESTIPLFEDVASHSTTSQWSELPDPHQTPTHPEIPSPSSERVSVIHGRTGSTDLYERPSTRVSSRRLDRIELKAATVDYLFKEFFTYYHPFIPFLDDQKSPDEYFGLSRLLFWAIIAVASRRYSMDLILFTSMSISFPRLLWSTLHSVPQSHHDVKALCLLCTWPFPINSSSYDPTFMLSGTMMALARQIGLHRPGHVQDFSKGAAGFALEDLQDRMTTWVACNIVSQCVATGYGQPSMTIYDWALDNALSNPAGYHLSQELVTRLRIEKFCDHVTKTLYCNEHDPAGIGNDRDRIDLVKVLLEEFSELEAELAAGGLSQINSIYIACVNMHLRLCIFFDSNSSNHYVSSFISLYEACQSFLSMIVCSGPFDQALLNFCPNYIFQITLAIGFSLLKFLRSPLREYVDVEAGRTIFNSAIASIRKVSVSNNDLPGRLADVLVQLWARGNHFPHPRHARPDFSDWQPLQLKVRTRMSSSVLWDCLLEWRRGFRTDTSNNHAASTSSTIDGLQSRNIPAQQNHIIPDPAVVISQEFDLDEMAYNDAFFPMNWLLDGIEDFSNPNHSGMLH